MSLYWNKNKFVTGEELYNMPIVGQFNRIPVNRLQDGVFSTMTTELGIKEFNKVSLLTFRLLVSGSLIIVDGVILHGSVPFIVEKEEVDAVKPNVGGKTTTAFQLFDVPTGQRYIKEWYKTPLSTIVTTYPADSLNKHDLSRVDRLIDKLSKLTPLEVITIDSEGIIIIENGEGILLPAMSTINRLDALMGTLEETTGEEALTWFVSNWVGDINKLMSKSKSGGRFAALPDGSILQNASDASFSDRIFKEINMLRPMYLEATYSFAIVPGESGIARYLGLLPYISKVKKTQRIISYVMDIEGFPIAFDNSIWAAELGLNSPNS